MANTGEYFDWREQSKCKSLPLPEQELLFFPSNGRSINRAKDFCRGCDVQDTCLEFALEQECKGVWAGTTFKERKAILKFRKELNSPVVSNPRKTTKKATNKKKRRNFSVS